MSSELTGDLHLEGRNAHYTGRWLLHGETMEWNLNGKTYRIDSAGDLAKNILSFTKVLGKQQLKENIHLRSCLTCENFLMSEMARDMSRGQRGVCQRHSFSAEICYLCPDYKRGNEQSNAD